jgi:peptidoglycan/LPS O-acetylase OafA/YrhL
MTASDRDTSSASPTHLAFLDGLRALAALAVVTVHSFQMYGYDLHGWTEGPSPVPFGDGLIDRALELSYELIWKWGPFAVPVFIVLSGFSLMLPTVRSPELLLSGGAMRFYRRRARRILPPYYAALALGMLITAVVPGFSRPQGVYWDLALPTFRADVILAHLLLVHNTPWSSDPLFGMRINPPLWSIAVEMQIYLLFPALLVLWRRAGALVTVGLAVGVGTGTAIFGIPMLPLSNTHYLGLFALGMLGAFVAVQRTREATVHKRLWLALAIGGMALFLVATALARFPLLSGAWVRDMLLGAAVLGLLVHASLCESEPGEQRPRYLALLSAPLLVTLGERSYSLYLVHAPVLALVAALFVGLPARLAYPLVFLVGVPACIAAAALFFGGIERRFLNSRRPALKAPALGAAHEGAAQPAKAQ